MALAERMLAARFNRAGHTMIDHYTYVIASDGDMQEGIQPRRRRWPGIWPRQAVAFYDDNHISIEGDTVVAFPKTSASATRPTAGTSQHLGEDIDLDASRTRSRPPRTTEKPTLIIVRTHIGYGAPNKQDTHEAHGSPLGEDEMRADQGGLRLAEPGALLRARRACCDHFREQVAERAPRARRVERRVRGLSRRPSRAGRASSSACVQARDAGRLGRRPADLARGREGHGDPQGVATRSLQWAAERVPGAGRRLRGPRPVDADR